MITLEAKLQLRLERIAKAAERAKTGNLRSVGYLISTIAKQKIKRGRGASPAGSPPHTRRGVLRRAIRYGVTSDKNSVVIGPAYSLAGTGGQPHEHGGRYMGAMFERRPTMGPSLEEAVPLIGPRWTIT